MAASAASTPGSATTRTRCLPTDDTKPGAQSFSLLEKNVNHLLQRKPSAPPSVVERQNALLADSDVMGRRVVALDQTEPGTVPVGLNQTGARSAIGEIYEDFREIRPSAHAPHRRHRGARLDGGLHHAAAGPGRPRRRHHRARRSAKSARGTGK